MWSCTNCPLINYPDCTSCQACFAFNPTPTARVSNTFHFVGIRRSKFLVSNRSVNLFDGVTSTAIDTYLDLDDTTQSLTDFVKRRYQIPLRYDILLLFSHLKLTSPQTALQNYGITDNSAFMVAIRDMTQETADQSRLKKKAVAPNAAADDDKKSDKEPAPPPLACDDLLSTNPELFPLVNIERGVSLDVITQENNVNIFRMPTCNHSMARDSLYQYAMSQFNDREEILTCPHTKTKDDISTMCKQKWPYPLIKQYLQCKEEHITDAADVKQEEEDPDEFIKYAKLEILASRNIIEQDLNLQRCPECKTTYFRDKVDTAKMSDDEKNELAENVVFCTQCVLCLCTFCWACDKKWDVSHECDQTFRQQTLKILAMCDTKTIGQVDDVPSVRACPTCAQLIYHVEYCKHMYCSNCHTEFCFVCLSLMDEDTEEWPCGDSDDICEIYPRQNAQTLPKKITDSSFHLLS